MVSFGDQHKGNSTKLPQKMTSVIQWQGDWLADEMMRPVSQC